MSDVTTVEEYADAREHLLDELVRIDLLLRSHLEAWWADRDPHREEFTGFFVSDEEVDRLLVTDEEAEERVKGRAGRSGDFTAESAGRLESVTALVRHRASKSLEAGVELRLFPLAAAFDLSGLEIDALLLALAPDIDPKYEKVYGYLRDDVTKSRPTLDLLLRVLTRTDEERLSVMDVFSERSTLLREALVRVEAGPTIPSSEVRVQPRIIEYLLGNDEVAGPISDFATVVSPVVGEAELFHDTERQRAIDQIAQLLAHWKNRGTTGDAPADRTARYLKEHDRERPTESTTDGTPIQERPLFAAFVGPDERAAAVAVDRVCGEAGMPILRIPGARLSRENVDPRLVRREACLQEAVVHVTSMDALEPDRGSPFAESQDSSRGAPATENQLEALVADLDRFPGVVFLSGEVSITADLQPDLDRHRFTRVAFSKPDYAQRRAIWEAVEDLPDDADPRMLAGTFRLSQGGIERAVETARSMTDGGLTIAAINEACRLHSRGKLDELATEIDPTYGWDDIVLPEDTLAHLREIAGAIRHRGTVFEEWGFADRFSLGNGINILFTGESGTGKTMAAEIIAGDVGLPLYKLDLSRIISKYIGETEKNLGRVFDAAEDSDAILFFDEADALFGTRTEISDSHDRYANVEVDYLLQRMEEHDGCVIMASNLKENIDDAFKRRINATLDFPMPDEEARREIWEIIFPDETPTDEIDVEFLAEFELSGGYIKNVAMTAAFIAAEEGETIGMEHVVQGLRREFQKTGKLYDLETFGVYRSTVDSAD